MEKLITWETDLALIPTDPKERLAFQLSGLEAVKSLVESGRAKSWGMDPAGLRGYSLTDMDEQQIFITLARFHPAIKFKVETMLSVDECLSCVEEIKKQVK